MSRPAVFLDRDGTIVRDTGYLRDPAAVTLLPGAAAAIARLHRAGRAIVVVTNQSGIARGIVTWVAYRAVADRIAELLEEEGAGVDATYLCPHHPSITGPCDCRKPGLAHYRAAAADLDLDLPASVWIGDRLTDVLPARDFGGRGVLLETAPDPADLADARRIGFDLAPDLAGAARLLLG